MNLRPRPVALLPALLLVSSGHLAWAQPGREMTVINPATDPVPVTATMTGSVQAPLAPSRQPFQRDVSVEVAAGSLSGSAVFHVPDGKHLVIEYVSGNTRVGDRELVRVEVRTTVGGDPASHTIPNHVYRRHFDPPTTDDFIVTYGQSVRIYADPGSEVRVTATRSENMEVTPTFFALAVSGHLIECGSLTACPIP